MKEELLKKLHTAMCNDNEHQCNRLNNYIHTDEYLTAEVVQVVNEIVAEETKELQEENKELTLKISRLESYCDAYNYSQRTYQEEIKELKAENEQIKNSDTLCKLIGEQKRKIIELEQQIEKMKKYAKLLQDICVIMGNDPYKVWRGLEQRVLILWDKSEEDKGLKMAENILDRLLKIKPQDWAEIEKWEIKEND